MKEFSSKDINFYYPALALEKVFAPVLRRRCRRVATIIIILTGVFAAITAVLMFMAGYEYFPGQLEPIIPYLGPTLARLVGICVASLSVWLGLLALDALYYSLTTRADEGALKMSYEAAQVFFSARGYDLVYGLMVSGSGRKLYRRLGLDRKAIKDFLSRKAPPSLDYKRAMKNGVLDFTNSAGLAIADKALLDFMLSRGITKEMFLTAARFIGRTEVRVRLKDRWWDIKNLRRVKGLGEEWSYGGAWFLSRFTVPFSESPMYQRTLDDASFGEKEAQALRTVLERSHETNALLVSDDNIGVSMVLSRFWNDIAVKKLSDALEHKKILILNGAHLIASSEKEGSFQNNFIKILDDTAKAGNIILVFEELPQFSQSARKLGIDFDTLIDPYLGSDKLQIIATSSPEAFHREFGESGELAQRFEQIFVKPPTLDAVVVLLENKVLELEKKQGVFFTYQSLRTIADSAKDYSGFGSMLDSALDLLDEAVVESKRRKSSLITTEHISALVSEKTGVPSTQVTEKERSELLNLEAGLSRRVIGQHGAISAVAGAVRRARSGLVDRNRPMSSFLFLGPTGVGKTETAKALADIFFEGEEHIIRLDMSEYNSTDAMARLIGSSESGQPGSLAQALRERPYGVLLLDEFEKAHSNAHDLFLQILDEGFFTDMRGKKVSARNVIVIATSNAGSNMIWKLVEQGKDPSSGTDEITKYLIEEGLFKPELLNRFDAVIVFHPLSPQDLSSVARIMLKGLANKVGQKGYKLIVTDELVRFLVKKGYDPAFGARPMRRAITDSVEQLIARKMIAGDIKPGDQIAFSREELKAME